MTRTIFYTATTLDGFIADEHDSLDWLLSQDIDEAGPMNYQEFIAGIGALAMGSTTYEWVLDHLDDEAFDGAPWPYAQPTWVFTHRDLAPVPEHDIQIVSGDIDEHWQAMAEAAAGKNIWVVGGGDLAAQFALAGRLDELVVSIAPVTLGAGRPLFTQPFDLRLTELATNSAFACARYEVLGPRAAHGTMAT